MYELYSRFGGQMVNQRKTRGVTNDQELNEEFLVRDTRSPVKKFFDWIKVPNNMFVLMVAFACTAFFVPEISDVIFLLSIPFFWFAMKQKESAPLKMPIQTGFLDPNQPHPATGMPSKAEGIFFLGNDIKTGKEIWVTNSDARQHFLVVGTTGAGKAQPLDALVHTPNGFVTMGSLNIGDLVTTPDGGVAPVLGIYPQGKIDIYRISFKDGRTAEACGEHLWKVYDKSGKSHIIDTIGLKEKIASGSEDRIRIPLSLPVEKPEVNLPIDPYVVGVFASRGEYVVDDVQFSIPDESVLSMLREKLPNGTELIGSFDGVEDKIYLACGDYDASLSNMLKKAGVIERSLPGIYLDSSISQRQSLLEGLLSTSGIEENGTIVYTTPNHQLVSDIKQLVWSLGGTANDHFESDWNNLTSHGQNSSSVHVVSIKLPETVQPFSSAKKESKSPDDGQRHDLLMLDVSSVDLIGSKEAQCIYVDHPEHLYITDNYVVTHNTESLLGFGANALTWGSGFLFCDGKGDVALFAKIYALSRRFGREDDLLVLNFMTGNQDLGSAGGKILSNTLNPFATGSSDSLTQMVVSLMDDAGGDGAMWKGRATAMLTGVMRALSWLRDEGLVDLNVGEIREFMALKRIIDLADTSKYPDLPPHIRQTIRSYLQSLPGYLEEKGYKQSQTTLDQHGYLEMQFTKILGSLADVYGHIFHTPYGEVDMHDVVLNRRILVIMLPALEKSGDEIANLGKIVVATLKGMMGGTLGSSLEGNWQEVVDNRPTNSPSPFICILDEVGYYTVEGMALMAAQARSLGFTMVYASQDIPAMKRLNEKEAASIIANTNTKIFMRSEEAEVTGKLAVESGGRALKAQVGGYQGKAGNIGVGYTDTMDARLEKEDRVNFLDLKAQGEGEMHVMFQDKVVRAKGFYANPEGALDKKKLRLRANHFIKVAKPDIEELESKMKLPEIMKRLLSEENVEKLKADADDALKNVAKVGSEIDLAALAFEKMLQGGRKPVESGAGAVAAVINDQRDAVSDFTQKVMSASGISAVELIEDEDDIVKKSEDEVSQKANRRGIFSPKTTPNTPVSERKTSHPLGEDFEDTTMPFSGVPSEPPEPASRRQSTVKSVPHGVTVDNNSIVDMADSITSNDAIMKALAALDFDVKNTNKESVESAFDMALENSAYLGDEMDYPEPEDILIDDSDSALSDSIDDLFDDFEPEKEQLPPAEKKSASSADSDSTTDFLKQLLEDDDDD